MASMVAIRVISAMMIVVAIAVMTVMRVIASSTTRRSANTASISVPSI